MRRFLYLCLILSCLSGCVILAPFIQAWKNAGATEADRMQLFSQQIKRFGEALYWGKGDAVLYVDKDADADVRKSLSFPREDIRIVESRIKDVEYEDEAFIANVELSIKYYRIPVYIVTEAAEKQVWRFRLGDHWYLQKREVSKELKELKR